MAWKLNVSMINKTTFSKREFEQTRAIAARKKNLEKSQI